MGSRRITSLINKIKNSMEVIKVFENWYVFFLDQFNLIKKEEIVYKTRVEIEFLTRTNSLDRWVIKEIFGERPYLIPKPGDVVVDVGAHIGTYSLLACRAMNGEGKIYAYEPDPDNFDLLKKNISINRPLSNIIKAYNKAIAGDKGIRKFYLYTRRNKVLSGYSSFSPYQSQVSNTQIYKTIEVECITLKDVFESNNLDNIDLLKMDCEGCEYEILFSSKDYIKKSG